MQLKKEGGTQLANTKNSDHRLREGNPYPGGRDGGSEDNRA
ncbi:hypothetical protein SDC9_169581 [bioreactor metagenome]|uniref:Uncharacterized protein n=1 Tax=bioreactor metagenome TaxID=1076179 RepID=A0A645G5Q4_9ZZZZ